MLLRETFLARILLARESFSLEDHVVGRMIFSRETCFHEDPVVVESFLTRILLSREKKNFSRKTCFREDYSVGRIFSHENLVVMRIFFCKKTIFKDPVVARTFSSGDLITRILLLRESFFSQEKPVFTRILTRIMASSGLGSPHELHGFTNGFLFGFI